MSEIIQCVGRRRLIVSQDKQTPTSVDLEILLKNNHLATLILEEEEAQKLLRELNKVIWENHGSKHINTSSE